MTTAVSFPESPPETPDLRRVETLRVLHVVNGEHYAGAERVQDLLAQRLPDFGISVRLASLKRGQFATARACQRTPLDELAMANRFDLRPVRQIVELIRDQRCQIVHTHTPRAALVGRIASSWAQVPMVHHVHSPTAQDSTRPFRNWSNAQVERFCIGHAAALVGVSESMGQYARQLVDSSERIRVVPNGVPCVGPLRRRAMPDDCWTLGTVALLRPRKGLEVLIDGLALLRRQGLNARLRVVGDFETDDYRREILKQVDRTGLTEFIEWTGFQQDVNAEFEQMDVFVLPSLFGEGLPMVVLEAMACGVPIVGTRVEGVPEAVRDSIDGALANPGDVNDLARAIRRIVDGDLDWQALRRSAHARQAERFSDRSMAEGIATVYREVINR